MDRHFSLSQMDVTLVPFWTGEADVKVTAPGKTLFSYYISKTSSVFILMLIIINETER
jgi:hypothetical protein